MSESKELVNWEEKLAQEAKAVAKTERPAVSRISLRSGILAYQDQAYAENQMDCIVLAAIQERAYYSTDFDTDKITPPDCFGFSPDGVNFMPHEVVPEPQASSCDGCWANKWESAKRGKGRACPIRRKLILIPSMENVEDYENAEIAVLSIPPTSTKNWGNYVNSVAASIQRPTWGVITRIKAVPDAKTQFKVNFSALQSLPNEALRAIHSRMDMALTILNTPPDMTPLEEKEEESKDNKKKKY